MSLMNVRDSIVSASKVSAESPLAATLSLDALRADSLLAESLLAESLLVRRAQRGDAEAFDEIVATAWTPLVTFAQRRLGVREDAEDAVLRAMVKAHGAIASFDGERPLRPWLRTIVANCCTDIARRRRDESPLSLGFAESYPGTDDVGAAAESVSLAETVREAIARLPKHYAAVMTMRVVHDLSIEEIAKRLGRPIGTIKSWLFRARTMLQQMLSPALAA